MLSKSGLVEAITKFATLAVWLEHEQCTADAALKRAFAEGMCFRLRNLLSLNHAVAQA